VESEVGNWKIDLPVIRGIPFLLFPVVFLLLNFFFLLLLFDIRNIHVMHVYHATIKGKGKKKA
jgi:hypothetical protein